jgi:hypothetical protein
VTLDEAARHTVAWLDSRHATRATQALAALALLLSLWFGAQQYQLTTCQAAYNEVSNQSQRARAEAAATDRAALRALMTSVANSPRTSIAEIRRYNQALDAADRQRAANPVPPPPSTNCG